MQLHEWEIWHTYSSTLQVGSLDLARVAERLVSEDVAICVLHRDGQTLWRDDRGIGSGVTTVSLDEDGGDSTVEVRIEYLDEKQPRLDGFALEAWHQASRFRGAELRTFHSDSDLPPPYIRAYLGKCLLVDGEAAVTLYPVVVLYETGVILVEFRMISPERPTPLGQFIEGGINLFAHAFDHAECPSGLVRVAARAWSQTEGPRGLRGRAALLRMQREHEAGVRERTWTEEDDDFKFSLSPLPSGGSGEKLHALAIAIMRSVAFLSVEELRVGVSYVLWGQRPLPSLGGLWVGRPHVYLVRFDGQRETAEKNLKHNADALAAMFARAPEASAATAADLVPPDSRLFSDYSALIGKELSVWMWSRGGVRSREKWRDPNRGHLIYEHQATMDLVEYGYMLHQRYLDGAWRLASSGDVITAREDVMGLTVQMERASGFGEIRELLRSAWGRYGLTQMQEQIRDVLALRGERAREREQKLERQLGLGLAVVFGMVAVPSLADQVLLPLWDWLSLPRPDDAGAFRTLLNLISLVGVSGVVGCLYWRTRD